MINNDGVRLLKVFEGCQLKSYKCPAGIDTIGYGATMYQDGTKVEPGDKISQKQADELLVYHLGYYEKAIKKLVKVELTDNQMSALIVFVYNIGVGAFSKSTLLKKINKNPNDPLLKVDWIKWCYANGKVMKGLIRRRLEEFQLYIKK